METLRAKGTLNGLIKKVKKVFYLEPQNDFGAYVYREDDRVRKMLQQREEFRRWANTF